jgi:hypothetical protein
MYRAQVVPAVRSCFPLTVGDRQSFKISSARHSDAPNLEDKQTVSAPGFEVKRKVKPSVPTARAAILQDHVMAALQIGPIDSRRISFDCVTVARVLIEEPVALQVRQPPQYIQVRA